MRSRPRQLPARQIVQQPIPWPESCPHVVLMGGTFDPPHRGHIELADQGRLRIDTDAWLAFVPAAVSPFKVGERSTPSQHRLAMLKLAICSIDRAVVWTEELDRGASHASYTIDTLQRARAISPHSRFSLLIGADQAIAFHKWRAWRDIMSLADVRVLPRAPLSTWGDFEREVARVSDVDTSAIAPNAWRSRWLSVVPMDARATDLRAALRHAAPEAAQHQLHPAVLAYIKEHGLYRSA